MRGGSRVCLLDEKNESFKKKNRSIFNRLEK